MYHCPWPWFEVSKNQILQSLLFSPLLSLTYDTQLILLYVAVASWQTLHHSGTWGCVDSRRSPPLGQWVQSIHE